MLASECVWCYEHPMSILGQVQFKFGSHWADELLEGEPWEISNGFRVSCMPTGVAGADGSLTGGIVVATDPDTREAGYDLGHALSSNTIRAPDLSVGNVPKDTLGWAPGAPPLALEYASVGQDENSLLAKIVDFLRAGTKHVWVVRMVGPRRVEGYEPNRAMRIAGPGDLPYAPGILRNPVRVEALYDRDAAIETAFRNLLQRRGYESLDEVIEKGAEKELDRVLGELRDELRRNLEAGGICLSGEQGRAIEVCRDFLLLTRWIRRAALASSADEVFLEG